MSALSKLKLSSKTRPQSLTSPEARVRQKLIDAIQDQILLAEAEAKGEVYSKRGLKYVTSESGERVKKEIPIRIKRWWFRDESGTLFFEVRYGNRRIAIKNGKTAVEVGDASNLVPTLRLLVEAINTGELDKPLIEISSERAARFQRGQAAGPSSHS
jgi:hypothetical protein